MLLCFVNILTGFILGYELLREILGVTTPAAKDGPNDDGLRKISGIIAVSLGALGLVDILAMRDTAIPFLDANFILVIPAIISGLLLSENFFSRIPGVSTLIAVLRPHRQWIGVYTLVVTAVWVNFFCSVEVCGR